MFVCSKLLKAKFSGESLMKKKTVLLFLKALVIGLILNFGVQQATTIELTHVEDQLTAPKIDRSANLIPATVKTGQAD